MAHCTDCELDMTTADGCIIDALTLGGHLYARAPFGAEPGHHGPAERCGDCGATRGHHHHLGCDLACCPACGWQLLSCGCAFEEYGVELLEQRWSAEDLETDHRAPGLVPA